MIDTFQVLQGATNDASKKGLDALAKALVPLPLPLSGRETIQLVLLREVQDYTILRTEETRELNTVWTRATLTGNGAGAPDSEVERVAFLASKQKGAESRELEALLRTWNGVANRTAAECYLKSKLCMECPRCVLFGATDVGKSSDKGANIKHRIAYATAFSLLPVDPALRETHTFNGVDGATQMTGQTLGNRESVRPGALFTSIVTLRCVTELELLLALKAILSCTRYGAETRIGGLVRNHVVGAVAGHEEIISPLELTIELASHKERPSIAGVCTVLERYRQQCASPKATHVLAEAEVAALLDAVQGAELTKEHLDSAYKVASDFRKAQAGYAKKAKD